MDNPIKMDDLGGKPTTLGNPHILTPFVFGVLNPQVAPTTHQLRSITLGK